MSTSLSVRSLVKEYVRGKRVLDGVSLAHALRTAGGAFSLERALALTLQICDAVGEAHDIHRAKRIAAVVGNDLEDARA